MGGTLVARRDLQIDCEDDIDGDGIPHCVEKDWNLDPYNPDDALLDGDADGLNNYQEYVAGTDPTRKDTDGDGMPDGYEVNSGLDPLVNDRNLDADGDGYSNWTEYLNGTDPQQPDPPLPVQTISVISGDGSAYLSWRASSLAGAYKVYVSEGEALDLLSAAVFETSEASFYHESLTNGALYHYAVSSVNSFGESDLSPVRTARPNYFSWKDVDGDGLDGEGNIYDIAPSSAGIAMYVYGTESSGSFVSNIAIPSGQSPKIIDFSVGLGGHACVLWHENDRNNTVYVSFYSPENRAWTSRAVLTSNGTVYDTDIDINQHGDVLIGYMQYSRVWDPEGQPHEAFVPYAAFKSSFSSSWVDRRIDGYQTRVYASTSDNIAVSIDDSGNAAAAWYMTQWVSGMPTYEMPKKIYANTGSRGSWQNLPTAVLDADYVPRLDVYVDGDMTLVSREPKNTYDLPAAFAVAANGNWSGSVERAGVRMGDAGGLVSASKAKRALVAGISSAAVDPAQWSEINLGGSKSTLVSAVGSGKYSNPRILWTDDAGVSRQSYFSAGVWQDEIAPGASPVTAADKVKVGTLGRMVVSTGNRVAAFLPNLEAGYVPFLNVSTNSNVAAEGATIRLGADARDGEGQSIVTYEWSQISGPTALMSETSLYYTNVVLPQVDQQEQLVFRVIVTDSGGDVSQGTVTVTVNDLGPQPSVEAGPDQQVDEGQLVQLSASALGQEGDVFQYSWSQVSGPSVTIANRYTSQPTLYAPQVTGHQTLVFEVIAQVQGGNWNRDTVTITVNDLDPIDSEPPVVSHSVISRKSKGKTYFDVSITSSEPGQTLFRYTEGLTIQVYAQASTEYPGWYAYPGSLTFQAGTGSKVVEYFAVDASGNTSAIQSTGEL